MSNFNQSEQNVGNQYNTIRDIVHNYVHPPVETIKAAWSFTSKCFQSILPDIRRTYFETVQFDTDENKQEEIIKYKKIEGENIRIQLKEEENQLKREDIELKREEIELKKEVIRLKEIENELKLEENKLQEKRFNWEKSVVQEKLELIRNFHTIDIEKKQKELQNTKDMHYLPLQGCREDIIEFLSQEHGKFVIIPSPPEVLRDDIQAFKSLKAEIPPKLKHIIEKYYDNYDEKTQSVINYKNIFNNHVEELCAATVGKFIAPIPNLIFRSQITNQKVFIWITITCPIIEKIPPETETETETLENQSIIKIQQKTFLLPEWNWMKIKKEMELQGEDFDTSIQTILDLISSIHLIVTLYFCDLYCLNLNPKHNPKLFSFLNESDFPDSLRTWTIPLQNSLKETQKQIQEELDRIRSLHSTNVKQNHNGSNTEFSNFDNTPVIGFGLALMFLFGMCSQQSTDITKDNTDNQNSIEQGQNRTGIIQVNRRSNNPVNLRVTPNGKIIRTLQNGTPIIVGKFSNNGQWLYITTKDGKSGWVWSKFVK